VNDAADDEAAAIAHDLEAVAEVRRARREIDIAIGELAARPLDEKAADRMREILTSPRMSNARQVMIRLARRQSIGRRRLSVVRDLEECEAQDGDEPALIVGGAA